MHLYVLAGVCHAELFSHICSSEGCWGGGGKKNQTKYMKAVMNYSDLGGRCVGGGGCAEKIKQNM